MAMHGTIHPLSYLARSNSPFIPTTLLSYPQSHSQINHKSFPGYSQIWADRQILPKWFPGYSQVIPKLFPGFSQVWGKPSGDFFLILQFKAI